MARSKWSPVGSLTPPYWRTELFARAFNEWRPISEHVLEEDAIRFCKHKQEIFTHAEWRIVHVKT